MNKFIFTSILLLTFFSCGLYASKLKIDVDESLRLQDNILLTYSENEEEYKFVLAYQKVNAIFRSKDNSELFNVFPILEPFLKSKNHLIRKTSTETLRCVKTGIKLITLTLPPDDASCEEVKTVMVKLENDGQKLLDTLMEFLQSCERKKVPFNRNK